MIHEHSTLQCVFMWWRDERYLTSLSVSSDEVAHLFQK